MLDTANMTLFWDQYPNYNFLDNVPQYLTEVRSQGENKYGDFIYGSLDSLKVKITSRKVAIYDSSICKYLLGNNIRSMKRGDIERSIEKISDSLHLPFKESIVHRMDFAQNLLMNYPKQVYLKHLGQLRYYNRLMQPNGLYYQNGKRQLIFYDKGYEYSCKGITIPEEYKSQNILRYEIRFKKGLKKQFKRPEIKGKLLYDEAFYIESINWWYEEYCNIKKINFIKPDKKVMSDIREFRNTFYLLGLKNHFGEMNKALDAIDILDKMNCLNNRTQKSRLKQEVQKAFNFPELTDTSEVIQELDRKVDEAMRYYR